MSHFSEIDIARQNAEAQCQHPNPYAWFATDEHGKPVLCLACTVCGQVLKGGAAIDAESQLTAV